VSFFSNIKNYKKKIYKRAEKVLKKTSFDILTGLIDATPVDTGRAKGNWNLSTGTPDKQNGYQGGLKPETTAQEHIEPAPEVGLIYCPNCGFKVPDSLIICWKCGQRLRK